MDPYSEAHLFVAAVRVSRHQKQSPPALNDICEMLHISTEAGLAICRRLEKKAIVTVSEDPFSIRLSIGDHLAIENLPRQEEKKDTLSRELEEFMSKKKDMDKKVASIQADLQKKKENLKSDFEARLRQEIDKVQNKG